MKKPALLVVMLLVGGFFVPKAHALTYYQPDSSHKDTGDHYAPCLNAGGVKTCMPLGTGLQGVINSLQLSISGKVGTPQADLTAWIQTSTTSSASSIDTSSAVVFTYHTSSGHAQAFTTSSTTSLITGATYTLDPTKYYWLTFLDSGGFFPSWWGTTSGTFGYTCTNNSGHTCDSNTKAPYFSLNTIGVTAGSGVPVTSWVYPLNHASTTAGAINLHFQYAADASYTLDSYYMDLKDLSNTIATTTGIFIGGISGTSGDIIRSATVVSGHLYQACVSLISHTSGQTFDTPCVTFSAGVDYTTAFFNSPVGQGYFSNTFTCNVPSNILDVGGGISYAFCQLFVPSFASTDQFSKLSLSTKFPFSYLADVIADLTAISISSSGFASSTIALNSLNIGSSTSIGNVLPNISFGKGSAMQYLGTSNYNTLIDLQGLAIYLGFLFYVYRRVVSTIAV